MLFFILINRMLTKYGIGIKLFSHEKNVYTN